MATFIGLIMNSKCQQTLIFLQVSIFLVFILSPIFSLTPFIPLSPREVLKFYFLQTGLQFTRTSFSPLTITIFYITRNS
jgi:hypothetical protein